MMGQHTLTRKQAILLSLLMLSGSHKRVEGFQGIGIAVYLEDPSSSASTALVDPLDGGITHLTVEYKGAVKRFSAKEIWEALTQ